MFFHAVRAFWRVLTRGYPRMTVDTDTGAIYVYVQPGVIHRTRTLLLDQINADYDVNEQLLGVEIIP